jgi:hypothetical protein
MTVARTLDFSVLWPKKRLKSNGVLCIRQVLLHNKGVLDRVLLPEALVGLDGSVCGGNNNEVLGAICKELSAVEANGFVLPRHEGGGG